MFFSTELALFTFVQIVDGLPTADIAWDRRYPGIDVDDHPIERYPELCPGVLDRTREIRDGVDLSSLLFDTKVSVTSRRLKPGWEG